MFKEFIILIKCLKDFELWYTLGLSKLRIRYLRTKLGPLWEILGTLLIISVISLIWSKLWGKDYNDFLPYLFFGYVIWKSILSIIGDANMLYHEVYKNVLENIYIHPFKLAIASVAKNFIILIGFIACCLILNIILGNFYLRSFIYLTLFIIFFFISSVCLSYLFGMLCLKFRDLQHTIGVVLNLSFFVTPVIWQPEQLGIKGQLIIDFNIIYYYIEFFRSSLINGNVDFKIFMTVFFSTLFLSLLTIIFSNKYSRKIIFWLI